MTKGPTPYATKLANCIRQATSNFPGEAAAGLRALRRTLEANGEDLHDLADRLENAVTKDDMKRIYNEGFAEGVKQVERRQSRELSTVGSSRNEEMARFCWERHERLPRREFGFIEGLIAIYDDGDEPSGKQIAWLISISRRLGWAD